MTYLEILAVFIVLPCVLLAPHGVKSLSRLGRRGWLAIPIMALIALIYTTPWDNYLIWRGVWDSPADRIMGRIGYVPVEEYAFFLLQPVLTGLWFAIVLRVASRSGAREPVDPVTQNEQRIRAFGGSLGAAATAMGVWLLSFDSSLYLGAILAWTGPVLAGMWWTMGDHLWRMRGSLGIGVALPTFYLWIVDRIALAEGAWVISEIFTTGIAPLGLPIEEALFFLVTNVMVVLGLGLLLLPELQWSRGGVASPRGRNSQSFKSLEPIGSSGLVEPSTVETDPR